MMRKSWKEAAAIQTLIRYKIYSKTLIVRNYIKKFSIILMMEKVLVCTVSLFSVIYICAVGVGGMEGALTIARNYTRNFRLTPTVYFMTQRRSQDGKN